MDRDEFVVENFVCAHSYMGTLWVSKLLPNFAGNTVTTPKQAVRVGFHCFEGCRAHNVILNKGLQIVGREAFWDCGEVRRVWIPNTVTLVEQDGLRWDTPNYALELFFEGEPNPAWRREVDELVTAPNPHNFHRSSGSWDEEDTVVVGKKHVVKDYKSPRSVVHTHFPLEDFVKLCQD